MVVVPYSVISQDGYTNEQRECFNYIKENINRGIYIDIGGNEQYLYDYINNIVKTYSEKGYKDNCNKILRAFINLYEKTNPKVIEFALVNLLFFDIYENAPLKELSIDFEKLYSLMKSGDEVFFSRGAFLATIFRYLNNIESDSKIPNEYFIIFAQYNWKSFLTEYGIENNEEILGLINDVLDDDYEQTKINYLYRLFNLKNGTLFNDHYETDEYLDTFWNGQQGLTYRQLYETNVQVGNILVPERDKDRQITYLMMIIRESENRFRQKKGLPRVGEGWISESLLYRRIEAAFPEELVIQHASPAFLGRQHYDVFFPERGIALEYQGAQHFEAVDYFGGEEAFKEGQLRDERKKRLSKENNIILIEVMPDYDLLSLLRELIALLQEKDESYNTEDALETAFFKANLIEVNKDIIIKNDISNELEKRKAKKEDKEKFAKDIDLIIAGLVSEKTPSAKRRLFNRVQGSEFEKAIIQYDEVEKLRKTNPDLALEKGMYLINEGIYAAPAIYECMAKILRAEKRLQEELELLLQMKCDFEYKNFDDRIRNLYKKLYK